MNPVFYGGGSGRTIVILVSASSGRIIWYSPSLGPVLRRAAPPWVQCKILVDPWEFICSAENGVHILVDSCALHLSGVAPQKNSPGVRPARLGVRAHGHKSSPKVASRIGEAISAVPEMGGCSILGISVSSNAL